MNREGVVAHIVGWLKSYAISAHAQGFVVGISGGIDSAVTSSLCALTGMEVLLLEMPIHQNARQVSRAAEHIHQLKEAHPKVQSGKVELTPTFEQLVSALPIPTDREKHDFSLVNARARLRMTTLYYFAALKEYLVAGTGNKVEDFGVGFFTKYGDGGVDISPIADLAKSQVYQIGEVLGISPSIMTAPPTDGLWGDDRTDEDQIGATYDELEWAMEFSDDEASVSARQKQVLEIYRTRHRQNLHKMVPIPVCTIPSELK